MHVCYIVIGTVQMNDCASGGGDEFGLLMQVVLIAMKDKMP